MLLVAVNFNLLKVQRGVVLKYSIVLLANWDTLKRHIVQVKCQWHFHYKASCWTN